MLILYLDFVEEMKEKGKVVSSLCKNYDIICRFNGGNNAGHTI